MVFSLSSLIKVPQVQLGTSDSARWHWAP